MISMPKAIAPQMPSINTQLDLEILKLYPTLNNERTELHQRLNCLLEITYKTSIPTAELASKLKLTTTQTRKMTTKLSSLNLIETKKSGKKTTHCLTTAGLVALMAFKQKREWAQIKPALATPQKRNDPLAYVLLLIGFCAKRPTGLYENLCQYGADGNILENIAPEVSAESLLRFYRKELREKISMPPAYLSVFKEFTTTGFQEVFRMLLVAVKPTPEDYNWLIEFFNEVADFYFDPARITFVNLLPENQKLRNDLEQFKKSLDQQIKKQDGTFEVTFTIPGSGLSKVDAMPPHLRAIGMRLILEPAKFINKELVELFWT
jgi:DNA-binding MarR family transcriptional regulator